MTQLLPEDTAALLALGCTYLPEFISQEEERELIPKLMVSSHTTAYTHPGRSRVQRYGSKKPYNNYMISETIPPHFVVLGERLVAQELIDQQPDSVTINEYLKGDVIQAHVDAIGAGPVITVLSLGSSATMLIRRNSISYTVLLAPRSLIQLRGESRYKWTHEILPVNATRYSVVFRNSSECAAEA